MPNKTRIIGEVKIPKKYFFDFLRGHLDGDGSTYSYFDPRWKTSFLFYLSFVSASEKHTLWLRETIQSFFGSKRPYLKGANEFCVLASLWED